MSMPAKMSRRGKPWTLAELKPLGKVPDAVLAHRTKRTSKEVVAERETRRIRLASAMATRPLGLPSPCAGNRTVILPPANPPFAG